MLKITRIIYNLTLIIYYIKIKAYETRIISFIKACDLVLSERYIYNKLRDIP